MNVVNYVIWPWQSIWPTKMAQTEAHQAKSIKILAERRKEKRRKNLQESCPLWGHSLAEKKLKNIFFFYFHAFHVYLLCLFSITTRQMNSSQLTSKILYNYQSGFRTNHSTNMCLSFLTDRRVYLSKGF